MKVSLDLRREQPSPDQQAPVFNGSPKLSLAGHSWRLNGQPFRNHRIRQKIPILVGKPRWTVDPQLIGIAAGDKRNKRQQIYVLCPCYEFAVSKSAFSVLAPCKPIKQLSEIITFAILLVHARLLVTIRTPSHHRVRRNGTRQTILRVSFHLFRAKDLRTRAPRDEIPRPWFRARANLPFLIYPP